MSRVEVPGERAPTAAPAPVRRPRVTSVGTAVFFTFFGFYLLFGSRQRTWADATAMWQVAESLVARGSVAISARWLAPLGPDGKVYSKYPLADSLIHVPGAAARQLVERLVPGTVELLYPLACHLGPAVIAALTCAVFFRLARRMASAGAASLATLIVGLGTGVCYYARSPYSEALQTLAFTGFMLAVLDALSAPTASAGRRLGLWAALLFNAKLVFLVSLPGVAAIFAWRLRREPRRLVPFFAWATASMLPGVAMILAYNWVRWGSVLQTGYDEPMTSTALWHGLWGLLLSPGKSVFLYSPPLILALAGLPALVRRQPAFTGALLAAFVPVLLVYANFPNWDGDWAWGPRYLTFALPAFCLPLALLGDALRSRLDSVRRRLLAVALAVAFATGGAVQLIGCSLYWGHWFRIATTVSEHWLGKPTCAPPPGPGGVCYPDDKELSVIHWLPSFQPIAGHLWLLRHAPFGDPFAVAEADAPWQANGKIHVPAAESWYQGTMIDWWPLAWGRRPLAATVVASIMTLVLGYGALSWRREVRSS